ncbi:hypothetical protein GLYMA_06G056800v4 [Glycine max]|uniref:Uncharacterized protein n=1 Tax=Glycine max TaxID=3847 RepID=A0A0R0JIP1_SOYBN|nr:hypothetical protein GYH30_014189 [Glycine max]KRH52261.1 hypothetical protein GLYMA_06G056800v4 [Glycine max]
MAKLKKYSTPPLTTSPKRPIKKPKRHRHTSTKLRIYSF